MSHEAVLLLPSDSGFIEGLDALPPLLRLPPETAVTADRMNCHDFDDDNVFFFLFVSRPTGSSSVLDWRLLRIILRFSPRAEVDRPRRPSERSLSSDFDWRELWGFTSLPTFKLFDLVLLPLMWIEEEVLLFVNFEMLAIVVDTANNFPALKLLPSEETDPSSSHWSKERSLFVPPLSSSSDFARRELWALSLRKIDFFEDFLLSDLRVGGVLFVAFFVVDTADNFPAPKLLPSEETDPSLFSSKER